MSFWNFNSFKVLLKPFLFLDAQNNDTGRYRERILAFYPHAFLAEANVMRLDAFGPLLLKKQPKKYNFDVRISTQQVLFKILC